jgi:hypothetical protein
LFPDPQCRKRKIKNIKTANKIKMEHLKLEYDKKIKHLIKECEGGKKLSELILRELKEQISALEKKRFFLEAEVSRLKKRKFEITSRIKI